MSLQYIHSDSCFFYCQINPLLVLHQRFIDKLASLQPAPTIYAIGRKKEAPSGIFNLISLYPYTHPPKEFSIFETLKNYKGPDSQMLFRGKDNPIESSKKDKVTVGIYEILGLDKDKIDKKFGLRS